MRSSNCIVLFLTLVVAAAQPVPPPNAGGSLASGPLTVCRENPRYFADAGGRPILLTGSHTWGNLQDYSYATLPSPGPMDFDAYLAFLKRHRHNFFRLWAWESAFNPGAKQGTISYAPLPFARTGPGNALDGKPRFDLAQFNPAYFERLRTRVLAAREQGIYVSVMLFNGFSVEGKGNVSGSPWEGHPLNPSNNINLVDGGKGASLHTLSNPAVTACQEAYVRKVIETVNDLDNVLYEISNEDTGTPEDIAWQTHMIQFIKAFETTKPKQHPVGMTVPWPEGDDQVLRQSPADWISPRGKVLPGDGRKVIINDTDHSYFWTGLKQDGPAAQRTWVWDNFTHGNQCLFMDPYLDPSHDPGRNHPADGKPDPYWDILRDAMGDTRRFSQRIHLAAVVPHPELASTASCLADPGVEYLVYQAKPGAAFDVELKAGKYRVEWFDTAKREMSGAGLIEAKGSAERFKPPFESDAVLYLVNSGNPARPPYPPSQVLRGIRWDWETYKTAALGSDLWPLTWGPDGQLYAAWGDGGGFGGSDSDGRVSMGFARIEGGPVEFHGINVNGGKNPQHAASFPKKGKTSGLAFIDGVLYSTINLQDGPWPDVTHVLAWSEDKGATWQKADWVFPKGPENFQAAKFVSFGQNYSGLPEALAGYVYLIGGEQCASPDRLYLARVARTRVRDGNAYEFFHGLDREKQARWTSDFTKAESVFTDPNGVKPGDVTYDPGLKRFLLTSFHTGPGQLGIFEAPELWGPWATIEYEEDWGGMDNRGEGLSCEFPQKWMSADGLTLWSVFSVYGEGAKQGIKAHDRFNLLQAKLIPAGL
jgi:hypothetical protein